MNLVEFNALKAGDRIDNAMSGSTGEVVEADKTGVQVKWTDSPGKGISGAGVLRHYSAASTIWFHWSKAEAARNDEGMDECCPGGCQHTPCRASAGSPA